jgi:hypothetical protein
MHEPRVAKEMLCDTEQEGENDQLLSATKRCHYSTALMKRAQHFDIPLRETIEYHVGINQNRRAIRQAQGSLSIGPMRPISSAGDYQLAVATIRWRRKSILKPNPDLPPGTESHLGQFLPYRARARRMTSSISGGLPSPRSSDLMPLPGFPRRCSTFSTCQSSSSPIFSWAAGSNASTRARTLRVRRYIISQSR